MQREVVMIISPLFVCFFQSNAFVHNIEGLAWITTNNFVRKTYCWIECKVTMLCSTWRKSIWYLVDPKADFDLSVFKELQRSLTSVLQKICIRCGPAKPEASNAVFLQSLGVKMPQRFPFFIYTEPKSLLGSL